MFYTINPKTFKSIQTTKNRSYIITILDRFFKSFRLLAEDESDCNLFDGED